MTLTELIHYFREGGSFVDFCQSQSLDPQSEAIEIFAPMPLSMESPLAFFEIERTGGRIVHINDNITYRNLFDFYFFQDAIAEAKNEQNLCFEDSDIARKLLSYALNDA